MLSPSGEVYNHDCVRWYEYEKVQENLNHYHNIGDAFVFDSSLKLLQFDELETLNIRDSSTSEIDYYNSEFDYCFLRGSNYIHSEMDWENAVPVLEKLKIPVIALGIGAQAPAQGPLVISETTERVLRLISDRCNSIGIRGAYTAEVLEKLGITNFRIVGCPTMFRARDPHLQIQLPPLKEVQRVGFTLRREVSTAYAKDVSQYLLAHRQIIENLAQKFDLQLMAQGEIEEKKIVLGTPEQEKEAIEQLKEQSWFSEWYLSETILKLYSENLFYSDVVSDYEQLVRRKDLVLGFRLHGNLMALANRVPSIYFTYDSRTTEFAETFKIPCYDVFSKEEFQIEDYWNQSLFDIFNATYKQRYRGMKDFLEENLIAHCM